MIIVLYSLFIKSRQRERKRGTEVSQRSEKVIQGLKKAYTAYFDIEEIDDGTALRARCAYHMRDSQYVLVKKAELWAAECHEYLYLWDAGSLDGKQLEEIGRRRQIVLEEFVFAGDAGVVRCGDDTYTNEAIFAFHKNR